MTAAVSNTAAIIAIDDAEINKRSCGRITMWDLSGDVDLGRLAAALGDVVAHPDEPSPKVALHRAVDDVARLNRLEVRNRGAGEWVIVDEPEQDGDRLIYPVACSAHLANDTEVVVRGPRASLDVQGAYDRARASLATTDVGNWLCDTLTKLGGIGLRDRGGVYFVPQDRVDIWERVVAALKTCSSHRVHTIPAMRSQDAVEAILTALTADTKAACDAMVEDIGSSTLGKRALETRENQTADLLARVDRYEGLLGTQLDELRDAIDKTRQAVAVARMMTSREDAS